MKPTSRNRAGPNGAHEKYFNQCAISTPTAGAPTATASNTRYHARE